MITAICMAFCVVLPLALHLIPDGGTLFSPMHLPVLLCGLVCGWQYGLLCGLLGPLLSSLITGMPGMGYLPTMIIELALYGFISGLLIKLLHTSRKMTNVYLSLVTAMLIGRIITGFVRAFLFAPGSLSIQIWATSYFVSCLPGIIIQLILLPILYHALERANLLPEQMIQSIQEAA
ncbi:MAG: ECF transporter S component [Lachnospiraceae bacterium]|nr:ECF transporter S component [Lachnospiraceae bacterium]